MSARADATRADLARHFDAMVLCAGLGTRLRPLTLERPKPAVPLLGRPLVGYALSLIRDVGFEHAAINTHWLPERMAEAARGEAARLGLALSVSDEQPRPLGTGGGPREAAQRGVVDGSRHLLVMNGDVLFDVDLERVLRTHLESGASATLVLRSMPEGALYSAVEVDDDGRIRRIAKVGAPSNPSLRRCLFTGVHVLSPEALSLVPRGDQGIVETAWKSLLDSGNRIQAVFDDSTWLDLGDPPGYLLAHLALLDGELPLPRLQNAGAVPHPLEPIHPAAIVEAGAEIRRSIVHADARVGSGARVIDSVVWEGAVVGAGERIERTIVTPKSRVVI